MTVALCLVGSLLGTLSPVATSASTGICVGGVYPNDQQAKDEFGNDCGRSFGYTTDYRCDWVPGGFQCKGPGSSGGGEAQKTPTTVGPAPVTPQPRVIRSEKGPDFVSLVWRLDGRIKGVNIYRDGQFLDSVNTPKTVYNDYSGWEGASYELVAYGHGPAEYSEKTKVRATNEELDPVAGLHIEQVRAGLVAVKWTQANNSVAGWRIYRNGKLWWVRLQGHGTEVFDVSPEDAVLYEVEPFRRASTGPRMGTLGPASLDYLTPTGRARPTNRTILGPTVELVGDLPATNARTRSLAGRAEQSAATAVQERQEFNNALGDFSSAGLDLAQAGVAAWTTAGVPVVGQLSAAVAFVETVDFIDKGLTVRAERIEAAAASAQAAADLKAYQDCMASTSCSRPPNPNPGSGGDGDPPTPPAPRPSVPGPGCLTCTGPVYGPQN